MNENRLSKQISSVSKDGLFCLKIGIIQQLLRNVCFERRQNQTNPLKIISFYCKRIGMDFALLISERNFQLISGVDE